MNLFQKFWGSLEVVLMHFLGCFEIVLSGMFFLNRLISKLSHGCPIRVEGTGVKAIFGKCLKVSSFLLRMASLKEERCN